VAPVLVQSKSGSSVGSTTTTITLTSATTAGNCLVLVYGSNYGATGASITGATLGGAADNWANVGGAVNSTQAVISMWGDQSCAGGQTSVVVTLSVAPNASAFWLMEWSGMVATGTTMLDKVKNGGTNGTSFASGTTLTTTQANEVWIGGVFCNDGGSGTPAITGPSSPWNNLAQVTPATGYSMMTSWQVVSATGTTSYSGTTSPAAINEAEVWTLKASNVIPVFVSASNRQQAVKTASIW